MERMRDDRVGSAGGDHEVGSAAKAAEVSCGLWQEIGKMAGRAFENAGPADGSLKHLPGLDLNNHWHFDKAGRDGQDQLSNKACVNLPLKDFLSHNPGVSGRDLSAFTGKSTFNVRHATTGQVDSGWKLDSIGKDGKVTLTKDYSLDVKHQPGHDGVIESLEGVSSEHTKALAEKLSQLPPNVLGALKDAGYKIIATPINTDAIPELKGKTPRGWPAEMTFDNSDGTHDNVRRVILAPEYYKDGEQFTAVQRPEVLVHQIGHALDHANGKLSNTPEFQQAFKADMKAMSSARLDDHERSIFNYFNQKEGPGSGERPGSEEAFAALFGMILTGPENPQDRATFEKYFPNTIRTVKQQIARL